MKIDCFEMDNFFGTNSEEDISLFEAKIKIRLPEDYRHFLTITNGGKPKLSYFQHPNFGVSLVHFYFGINFDEYDYRNLESATGNLRCMTNGNEFDGLIEIATDPGGLAICMGIGKDNFGNILLFDHDSGDAEDFKLTKISDSFSDFFNSCYETGEEAESVYDKLKAE